MKQKGLPFEFFIKIEVNLKIDLRDSGAAGHYIDSYSAGSYFAVTYQVVAYYSITF